MKPSKIIRQLCRDCNGIITYAFLVKNKKHQDIEHHYVQYVSICVKIVIKLLCSQKFLNDNTRDKYQQIGAGSQVRGAELSNECPSEMIYSF